MHLHTSHVLGKSKHRLLELSVFLFLVPGTFWLSNSITLTKTQVCVQVHSTVCALGGHRSTSDVFMCHFPPCFVAVLQEYQMSPESAALLDWLVNETQGPACLLTHPALRSKKRYLGFKLRSSCTESPLLSGPPQHNLQLVFNLFSPFDLSL